MYKILRLLYIINILKGNTLLYGYDFNVSIDKIIVHFFQDK